MHLIKKSLCLVYIERHSLVQVALQVDSPHISHKDFSVLTRDPLIYWFLTFVCLKKTNQPNNYSVIKHFIQFFYQ